MIRKHPLNMATKSTVHMKIVPKYVFIENPWGDIMAEPLAVLQRNRPRK